MTEHHRKKRHRKKIRLKRSALFFLLTTIICIGLASLIATATSNVYVVTGKIIVYIIAIGLLLFVSFLFLYSLIGRRR
jgi:uncharacterized BrkB/YihY/UPF0761 family membrane protein